MVREAGLVILASAKQEAVFVVSLAPGCATFTAVTEFSVMYPVISAAALWDLAGPVIQLYCIQTQVHVLNHACLWAV